MFGNLFTTGTKSDLRMETGALTKQQKKDASYVSTDEGMALAKSEKMFAYIESSALMSIGCHNAIKTAVEAGRNYEAPPPRTNACCTIL